MSDRHALPPYSLRMTSELRQLLEESAKKTKRSLNAEIVARLEESFSPQSMLLVDEAELLLNPNSNISEKEFRAAVKEICDAAKLISNHMPKAVLGDEQT
ncbi:Arc domain-containing protein [Pseudomonas marincola]|uniref:Arc-like DNA binding domain-containing protein n=1 Tax=Pseudomonas marincola TaxID=437900 RepID=A0A653E8Y0_9PSED|nr:Arc family DNA-binding protein [Pseudomonas marincola]CAE6906818.1 Arc domain-containing protein [Pseudomonas marincola]